MHGGPTTEMSRLYAVQRGPNDDLTQVELTRLPYSAASRSAVTSQENSEHQEGLHGEETMRADDTLNPRITSDPIVAIPATRGNEILA